MELGKLANVPVDSLVAFFRSWVFALYLDWPKQLLPLGGWSGNDKVKAAVPMREIDIPTGVSESARDIQFCEIVGDFHCGILYRGEVKQESVAPTALRISCGGCNPALTLRLRSGQARWANFCRASGARKRRFG